MQYFLLLPPVLSECVCVCECVVNISLLTQFTNINTNDVISIQMYHFIFPFEITYPELS